MEWKNFMTTIWEESEIMAIEEGQFWNEIMKTILYNWSLLSGWSRYILVMKWPLWLWLKLHWKLSLFKLEMENNWWTIDGHWWMMKSWWRKRNQFEFMEELKISKLRGKHVRKVWNESQRIVLWAVVISVHERQAREKGTGSSAYVVSMRNNNWLPDVIF